MIGAEPVAEIASLRARYCVSLRRTASVECDGHGVQLATIDR
ncbi:MAG: hypothetical protein ACJASK_002453, partial [Ilumatobacter sp.]